MTLQEVVGPGIGLERLLDDMDREMLATAIKQRLTALGSSVGIAVCRKLVSPPKRAERASAAPDWTEGWVYITSEDKFYRIDSEEFLTAQGFNAKFNRNLPPPAEGEFPKTAHRVALDEVAIPTVIRGMYVPAFPPLFEDKGVTYVNLYRHSSTPEAAKVETAAGLSSISLVRKHIELLVGGRKDLTEIMLSWLDHNVQKPGVKIRWAPLIKGIEGDGKSLIGRLMTAVMGSANVKSISPTVLKTDFTGWAHGACVGVLEEIRLTGHSRHDVHNALKPYIANDDVPIHAKGRDEFTAANTMNYIAFTNHADALPLGDNDRRFLVIFTPFDSLRDLESAVGDTDSYFSKIFDAIDNQPEQLRKWLLDMPISDKFKPDGRAPQTAEKTRMVDMGVDNEEDAVIAALEAGGVGIGKQALAVCYLRLAARQLDPDVELKQHDLKRILQKMGWSRYTKQIKWNGKVCRVWYRGMGLDPSNAAIQEALRTSAFDEKGNALFDDVL
jgi:hypothetical protein